MREHPCWFGAGARGRRAHLHSVWHHQSQAPRKSSKVGDGMNIPLVLATALLSASATFMPREH
jgi:hypothetical protein